MLSSQMNEFEMLFKREPTALKDPAAERVSGHPSYSGSL